MKNKFRSLLYMSMLAPSIVLSEDFKELDDKVLLSDDYPKAFYFRIPQRTFLFEDYEEWAKEFSRLNGMISKIGIEELASLPHDQLTQWMNQFAADYPEQMVFIHFNSFARDPNSLEEDTYFAGHWLYLPGVTLDQGISANTTTFKIDKDPADFFIFNQSFLHHKGGINDELAIIPIDDNGNKDWANAEYVLLTSYDSDNKTITVKRGHVGSQERTFASGKAYIAPIATMGPYGQPEEKNNKLWVYNMSLNSPKNHKGQNAAEVLVEEFHNWFGKGGMLENFQGISFDLPFWDIEARRFIGRRSDANNDGVIDGAVINGANEWQSGVRDFYVKLKAKLDDNILVIADTQYIFNQRGADILDGMEAEGTVDHADAYKGISNTINHVTYWQKYSSSEYPFNFTFYKDNSKDTRPELDKARFGFTFAQAMSLSWGINKQIMAPDAGYQVGMLDEVLKGEEKAKNWLGKPKGEMIRTAERLPDVLKGSGETLSPAFMKKVKSTNASVSVEGNSLIIESKSPDQTTTQFSIRNVAIPEGDITLFYDTKALTQLDLKNGQRVDSPYQVQVKFKNVKTPKSLEAKHLLGYTGPEGFITNEAYVRQAGPSKANIDFIIKGAGKFEFKGFKLNHGQPLILREFEPGAVISNPSASPACVDLTEYFSDRTYRYIKGTQNPEINSGQPVEGNQVCVGGVNGVVLATDE